MVHRDQYQYIDPSVLLSAVSEDISSFRSLLNTFLEIAPSMFERLRAAIDNGDSAAMMRQSHALVGTTGLIGAAEFTELLKVVEYLSRQSENERVLQYLPELVRLFDLVVGEVKLSIAQADADILRNNTNL